MAVGDILGVTISPEGWYAGVEVEGLGVGGTYDMGIDELNSLADPKIVFTVTSLGYDQFGGPTTKVRTVYGMKQLRKPYPNQSQNDEIVVGGNVIINIALSDYVFAKDKSSVDNSGVYVVAEVKSGLYRQGGVPSNGMSSIVVINNSTDNYYKVKSNKYKLIGGNLHNECKDFKLKLSSRLKRVFGRWKFTARIVSICENVTRSGLVY